MSEEGNAQITAWENEVAVHNKDASVVMSWPEANRIQYELRQACVDAGLTVRGI